MWPSGSFGHRESTVTWYLRSYPEGSLGSVVVLFCTIAMPFSFPAAQRRACRQDSGCADLQGEDGRARCLRHGTTKQESGLPRPYDKPGQLEAQLPFLEPAKLFWKRLIKLWKVMEAGSEICPFLLFTGIFNAAGVGFAAYPLKSLCWAALMSEKEPRGGARGGFQELNHQAVYTVRQYFSRVVQVCWK